MLVINFRLFFTHDTSSEDKFTFYLSPIIDGRVAKPRQARAFNRLRFHRGTEAQFFFSFHQMNIHV